MNIFKPKMCTFPTQGPKTCQRSKLETKIEKIGCLLRVLAEPQTEHSGEYVLWYRTCRDTIVNINLAEVSRCSMRQLFDRTVCLGAFCKTMCTKCNTYFMQRLIVILIFYFDSVQPCTFYCLQTSLNMTENGHFTEPNV